MAPRIVMAFSHFMPLISPPLLPTECSHCLNDNGNRAAFSIWGAPVKHCVGGPVNNNNSSNNNRHWMMWLIVEHLYKLES